MTKETKANKDLKEYNHKLKHQYDLMEIRLNALQYKYDELKEKNEELRALYESEREVKEDYKSKVNKAIKWFDNADRRGLNELLDILKGVNKE